MAIFSNLKSLLKFNSSNTNAGDTHSSSPPPVPPKPVRPQLRRHAPMVVADNASSIVENEKDGFLHDASKYAVSQIADRRLAEIRISKVVDSDNDKAYYVSNSLISGSTGKLRLALDVKTHTVWAFKEFRLPVSEYPGFKNRERDKKRKIDDTPLKFIRDEYFLGQKIQSPVRMRRLLLDDGRIYALMKYMDGGDLIDLMGRMNQDVAMRGKRMHGDRAALGGYLLGQLAYDLSNIHEKNIVHCDVKPDNIFFNKKSQVFLGDLGGCVEADSLGNVRNSVGTRGYFAPERVLSSTAHFTAAADIWAMGVTIAELWCDKDGEDKTKYAVSGSPFDANTAAEEKSNIRVFQLFRNQRLGGFKSGVDMSEILVDKDAKRFNDFKLLFTLIGKDDAKFSDYLLKKILDPNPATRSVAKDILCFTYTHVGNRQGNAAKQLLLRYSNGPRSKIGITLEELKRVAREDQLEQVISLLG